MKRLFFRVGSIMPGQMFRLGELLGTYRAHAFLLGRLRSPTAHWSTECTRLHYQHTIAGVWDICRCLNDGGDATSIVLFGR